jgi:hypothetical protein
MSPKMRFATQLAATKLRAYRGCSRPGRPATNYVAKNVILRHKSLINLSISVSRASREISGKSTTCVLGAFREHHAHDPMIPDS